MGSPYNLDAGDLEIITGIGNWLGKVKKEFERTGGRMNYIKLHLKASELALHNAFGLWLPWATLYILSDFGRFLEESGLERYFQ